ncbi:MAG: sigma-70 family RNA polymerase sigma factor [Myxococcaceae bacterium]
MNDFWKRAVEDHGHRLVLSLLASGLRLDEARDVAQETWLKVMEAAAAGKLERLEFPGLLVRQASFLVADRQRQRRARPPGPMSEAEALCSTQSPEHEAHAQQLVVRMRAGLATVTPREREVLEAALARPDVRHDELARSEGLSVQRFRQLLCSVRSKLRRVLEAT